jgi:hypothetical protein
VIISDVLGKNLPLSHEANAPVCLRDRKEPYLRGGESRIESLRKDCATDPDLKDFQQKRINQLLSWHRFFARVLPVFKALAGKV